MQVKGVNFRYKVKPKDHYFWFKKKLASCREVRKEQLVGI